MGNVVVVEDQSVSASDLLIARIQRELREDFGITHATMQLEIAIPGAGDRLPIHNNGSAIRS